MNLESCLLILKFRPQPSPRFASASLDTKIRPLLQHSSKVAGNCLTVCVVPLESVVWRVVIPHAPCLVPLDPSSRSSFKAYIENDYTILPNDVISASSAFLNVIHQIFYSLQLLSSEQLLISADQVVLNVLLLSWIT